VNGAYVKESGRRSRKENILERVVENWLRLLETDETNSLWDAMGQQKEEGEKQLDKEN
jgi:hypothetical protein